MLFLYRRLRVLLKRLIGLEPTVEISRKIELKFYGNSAYGGWALPDGLLSTSSLVVDIGLGEDISFSEALILELGCNVHGFDPTPRAITYVEQKSIPGFHLHKLGVAGTSRSASFYLPNDSEHVSGSIIKAHHVGVSEIAVQLIDVDVLFELLGETTVDCLKLDIEGAEYELINSEPFRRHASSILILCIEFHHRWSEFGPTATMDAVALLRELGFDCVWRNQSSNEEFTFLNRRYGR